jgi:hypothetical protein
VLHGIYFRALFNTNRKELRLTTDSPCAESFHGLLMKVRRKEETYKVKRKLKMCTARQLCMVCIQHEFWEYCAVQLSISKYVVKEKLV